ncbi:NF-kappa-B inhibitor-interacting Ras-like protein 1 isoform X1 [Manis pentadactyla]|uniref:NF-kappa-B inhibitor-interacting Ras-like protein 1 isoform X1 n=1 Tax=Manis pentadactyla TaxID=143292 RepID=UPI00255D0E07|nr:NF-kappa-B inhibitor-interacting Ras-like protein 1 isoform X1 [Manis pentadactyla]
MLLGSSPTGVSVFPVGSCGRPAPHGTCSSGREPGDGLGRPWCSLRCCPAPAPQDSGLSGSGHPRRESEERPRQPSGRDRSAAGKSDILGEDGKGLQSCGLWLVICGENSNFGAAPLWESYYCVNNLESFQRVELLKKEIDKFKDKKEVAIVVLGNKIDLSEQRQVDAEVAQQWAKSEKVRLWEVTVTDRRTLIEPFTLLASRLSQPPSKSGFPLPGRKNKGNASSEN